MTGFARRSAKPLIHIALALLAGTVAAPWCVSPVGKQPVALGPPSFSSLPGGQGTEESILRRPPPAPIVLEEAPSGPWDHAPSIVWEPQPQRTDGRPQATLKRFAVAPQPAHVAPPVAERIGLDPSVSEKPEDYPLKKRPGSLSDRSDVTPVMPDDLDTLLPPLVERQPSILPPMVRGSWPYPVSLIRQLTELSREAPRASAWSKSVIDELTSLSETDALGSAESAQSLARLHDLAEEARQLAVPQLPSRERSLRLRAGYALVRRLAVWDIVHYLGGRGLRERSANVFSPRQMAMELNAIEQVFEGADPNTVQYWRRYLRLSDLHAIANAKQAPGAESRAAARDVLRRLHSPQLNDAQCLFLSTSPFTSLERSLRNISQESIDLLGLLAAVEKHETTAHDHEARELAEVYQVARWSDDTAVQHLAEALNDNYRNANVRVAISEGLINRFLPEPQTMSEDVNDNIRGATVMGRTDATTQLKIVLIPDRLRWRLGLEANGAVSSETQSNKGPARFWNDGVGEFRSQKLLMVDHRGLKTADARTTASAEAFLKDFETNYDSIPLFGMFARNIARQQYENERPAARFEIEERISQRAGAKLDEEVQRRLQQAEIDFQTKLLDPLMRLNLDPTPVDMETTSDRLIVRYRLAGPTQAAAHTPRPQAPGDSFLSVQLHESVMNNSLQNLNLDGRSIDLRALYLEMTTRFGNKDEKAIQIPEDLPDDVVVHFADRESVRVKCEDGRVRLSIRLKQLIHEGEPKWKNFEVHGYYKPSDDQQEANLVRDGNIELAGEKLRFSDQVALRGIFAKVLSRNRTLAIVNKQLLLRKELSDLEVTQFVIQDGWIGVAVGPPQPKAAPKKPVEEAPHVTRRPIRDLFQQWR